MSCARRTLPRLGTQPWLQLAIMLVFVLIVAPGTSVLAQQRAATIEEMSELSLEDLFDIEVISLSKKSQPLSDVAAAAYVVTQDDIRRSGATSIPEALRLVPGLQVMRIDSNKWAVSARGFNGLYADKLLVLVDGRSVFNSVFSGVYWDSQDTMLDDIERIEVIRGPGGTLWGANAVNGIINIITASADETQGTLAIVGAGVREMQSLTGIRHGGSLGSAGSYRVYGKHFQRGSYVDELGVDAHNDWDQGRGGFRMDWDWGEKDEITFQGDVHRGSVDGVAKLITETSPYQESRSVNVPVAGENVQGRWTRSLSPSSSLSLQAYFDRSKREEANRTEETSVIDFDAQHSLQLGEHDDVVWGVGYRRIMDRLDGTPTLEITTAESDFDLWSAFVQNELALADERIRLITGSKLEHNNATGWEAQPSFRIAAYPSGDHTLWGAVTRAVSTPARYFEGFRMNLNAIDMGPQPILVSLIGTGDVKTESMTAFELGYRGQVLPNLTVDATVFANHYDSLVGLTPLVPFMDTAKDWLPIVYGATWTSAGEADTRGAEIVADLRFKGPARRLQLGYSYLDMDLHTPDPSELVFYPQYDDDSNPAHQLFVAADFDLSSTLQLDVRLRYVSEIKTMTSDNAQFGDVDLIRVGSYTTEDVRLAWRPAPVLEVSAVGRDLFGPKHLEFTDFTFGDPTAYLEPSAYLMTTWHF